MRHKKAIYRKYANSTLGRVPAAMDSETTAKTVDLARNRKGDVQKKAIDDLILGHIRLAGAIAARFVHIAPNKDEDIIAFAFFKLVELTNRIAQGELMKTHENYDAYIHTVLAYEINRFINEDLLVVVDTDSKQMLTEIRKDPEEYKDKSTPRELTEGLAVSPYSVMSYDLVINDLVVESQCFTNNEQAIIFARLDGDDDVEIAKKLGVSKQRIQQIREKMKPRLMRLTGEKR